MTEDCLLVLNFSVPRARPSALARATRYFILSWPPAARNQGVTTDMILLECLEPLHQKKHILHIIRVVI